MAAAVLGMVLGMGRQPTMITRDELETLINTPANPAVSIYTPTNLPSLAIRQDSIRLGNQIEQARRSLQALGGRTSDIERLLKPAQELLGEDAFWANNTPGLAIFLADGVPARIWRLPETVEELVVVGSRFHVAPLLPVVEGETDFHVLAISSSRARLFRGDRHGLREIPDSGLPQGVDETVRSNTEYEQNVDSNPISAARSGRGGNSGQPGSVPANQVRGPSPEEQRRAEFIQYLDKLASAFEQRWGELKAPVVLAALGEVAGNFMARTTARNILPDTLLVNPDALGLDDLHRRALAVVEPRMSGATDAAIDHFNSLYNDGSPRASLEPAEIVKAARWGRMDTLILAEGQHLWGRFDESADTVETHAEPAPLDDDLLDVAAQQTLLNGGDVRIVDRGHVPGGAPAAGIMRY